MNNDLTENYKAEFKRIADAQALNKVESIKLNKNDIKWSSLSFEGWNVYDHTDWSDIQVVSGNKVNGDELTDDEVFELNEHFYDEVMEVFGEYGEQEAMECAIDDAMDSMDLDR